MWITDTLPILVVNVFQNYLDFQGFHTIHKNVFTAPNRRSSTVTNRHKLLYHWQSENNITPDTKSIMTITMIVHHEQLYSKNESVHR